MRKIISLITVCIISLSSCDSRVQDDNAEVNFEEGNSGGTGGQTAASGKFTKYALLEDFTGTWCGYCPRVVYAIQQVFSQNIPIIPVAIHQGDAYGFAGATPIIDQFGIDGYPTVVLERRATWNEQANQIKPFVNTPAQVGIAMKANVKNGNISLDVKMKFGATMSNLKMVVYILENNLIHNQANYTTYFGGTSVIQDFDNDYVLRTSLTNISGDPVVGNTSAGVTIGKNYSLAIPANISNPSNISFVAFLLDSTGKVVNARAASSNVNQFFEEI